MSRLPAFDFGGPIFDQIGTLPHVDHAGIKVHILAPHWRHGLWLGSPFRGGRAGLGPRCGHGLCLSHASVERGIPNHPRGNAAGLGKELHWAWPRDGNRETLEGAGVALANQYKDQGLNMLHEYAHYQEGETKSVSVEAGLMDMLQRMQSGRFKVFKHLHDWFEEFRLYHRKDGKVVKEGDDLMAATRYAIMMLRFASKARSYHSFRRKIVYPKPSIA
jgi:hypothetical protein